MKAAKATSKKALKSSGTKKAAKRAAKGAQGSKVTGGTARKAKVLKRKLKA